MMKAQRTYGKFKTRSADEAQVSMLLKDYADADKMLGKVRHNRHKPLQYTY
jgi:hypothetical protein